MNAPHFPYTSTARPGSPETAFDAGKANELPATTIRAKCLKHILQMGLRGSTSDEGADVIGLPNPYSSRPRFAELRAAGLIVDSGDRRDGHLGRAQVVWIATEFALMPASLGEARHG